MEVSTYEAKASENDALSNPGSQKVGFALMQDEPGSDKAGTMATPPRSRGRSESRSVEPDASQQRDTSTEKDERAGQDDKPSEPRQTSHGKQREMMDTLPELRDNGPPVLRKMPSAGSISSDFTTTLTTTSRSTESTITQRKYDMMSARYRDHAKFDPRLRRVYDQEPEHSLSRDESPRQTYFRHQAYDEKSVQPGAVMGESGRDRGRFGSVPDQPLHTDPSIRRPWTQDTTQDTHMHAGHHEPTRSSNAPGDQQKPRFSQAAGDGVDRDRDPSSDIRPDDMTEQQAHSDHEDIEQTVRSSRDVTPHIFRRFTSLHLMILSQIAADLLIFEHQLHDLNAEIMEYRGPDVSHLAALQSSKRNVLSHTFQKLEQYGKALEMAKANMSLSAPQMDEMSAFYVRCGLNPSMIDDRTLAEYCVLPDPIGRNQEQDTIASLAREAPEFPTYKKEGDFRESVLPQSPQVPDNKETDDIDVPKPDEKRKHDAAARPTVYTSIARIFSHSGLSAIFRVLYITWSVAIILAALYCIFGL